MTTVSVNTPVRTIELFASAFDQNARDRLDVIEETYGLTLQMAVLDADPTDGPGAGLVRLYIVLGDNGGASLRMQFGEESEAIDIVSDFIPGS